MVLSLALAAAIFAVSGGGADDDPSADEQWAEIQGLEVGNDLADASTGAGVTGSARGGAASSGGSSGGGSTAPGAEPGDEPADDPAPGDGEDPGDDPGGVGPNKGDLVMVDGVILPADPGDDDPPPPPPDDDPPPEPCPDGPQSPPGQSFKANCP